MKCLNINQLFLNGSTSPPPIKNTHTHFFKCMQNFLHLLLKFLHKFLHHLICDPWTCCFCHIDAFLKFLNCFLSASIICVLLFELSSKAKQIKLTEFIRCLGNNLKISLKVKLTSANTGVIIIVKQLRVLTRS